MDLSINARGRNQHDDVTHLNQCSSIETIGIESEVEYQICQFRCSVLCPLMDQDDGNVDLLPALNHSEFFERPNSYSGTSSLARSSDTK